MYKDTSFFNTESVQYSKKRYPNVARSYLQFFFLRRLNLTKSYLRRIVQERGESLSLLEVGCADGIIIRTIGKEFPNAFSKLVGIDIAAEMIEAAREQNIFSHTEFMTRDKYVTQPLVDVVLETGVINYINFEKEMSFAKESLKAKGYYLFSIAGTDSLRSRLKGREELPDFRPYREYDRIVREEFSVLSVQGCGVFIPLIWRLPLLARIIQSIADPIVGWVIPSLCHEKVYLVQKKQS